MTFKKGDPRPPNAGRKKGVPAAKRTLRVGEILATLGINPIEKLLELIPKLPEELQAKYWMELQTYIQSKSAKSEDDTQIEPTDDPTNDESTDNLRSIAKS
jgi:hypothetical protein